MSGRPYARNPNGQLGGATDLEAILPHRFRLETPRPASLSARDQAVRRIIRERCREKNWKKLLIRRQLAEEGEAQEQPPAPEATAMEAEAPAEPEKTEDPSESAKQRILELETALKQLAEQKHAKFLQLKEMLVEEARSRSSVAPAAPVAAAPAPSAPAPMDASATKKRRVEFAVSSPGAATSSPRSASGPIPQDAPVSDAPAPADSSANGVAP